jgi:hypothetical protein
MVPDVCKNMPGGALGIEVVTPDAIRLFLVRHSAGLMLRPIGKTGMAGYGAELSA